MKSSLLLAAAAILSCVSASPCLGQPSGANGAAAPQPGEDGKPKGDDFSAKDLFYGVGIGLTENFGGRRTNEDFKVASVRGRQFVQITESQDTDIRILFETHALFRDQHVFGADTFGDGFAAFAACGPFSLVGSGGDVNRRGCGPFFAIALEPNAQVAEFGMGWFIGFGGETAAEKRENSDQKETGFGFGIGFLIDPDSRTVDGRIVDTSTMFIRPEFEEAVAAGQIGITTKETTTSLLVMVGKDF